MHRSPRSNCSWESASTSPSLTSWSRRRSGENMRRSASGVSRGNRPFGGSKTSDVRRVGTTVVPRSSQKLLYAPTFPPAGSGSSRTVLGAFARALPSTTRCSMMAASSSVKNSLSARASGRSSGVTVELFQMPPMSGSPQAQRGSFLWEIANSKLKQSQQIDYLFKAALARTPTSNERRITQALFVERARDQVGNDRNKRVDAAAANVAALQDIWWAVLNSNEFIINH